MLARCLQPHLECVLAKSLPKKVTELRQAVLLISWFTGLFKRLARMQEMWFPSAESLQAAPPSSLTHVSFMANSPNLLGICMHVK